MRISPKNSKLGSIPNISLVPVRDCGNCSGCKSKCYALKSWRMYPSVRKAWEENSREFRRGDWQSLFQDISDFLERANPTLFRIHVAGDFLSQDHVDFWESVARRFPRTRFLAFTKMHGLDYSRAPRNLRVVFSQWPGMPVSEHGPRAWYQDGSESRIPANATSCPGVCDTCGLCWALEPRENVVFEAH